MKYPLVLVKQIISEADHVSSVEDGYLHMVWPVRERA